ncbi:MAG: hypothetical protein ACI33S_00925 [Bacilli bacterium]
MNKEKKITFMIILTAIVLLSIITIPLIIKYNIEKDKDNFPEYKDIDIDEDLLSNEQTYEQIKKDLQNDFYFNKLAIMTDYDYKESSTENLQDLLWHFIFNYELSNDSYFSYTDSANGKYCFSKKNLINAFNEFYKLDITDKYNYLEGYYKYVYISSKGYCLDFKRVSDEYDNNIKIAIERMSILGTTITTDLYVYEYYASSTNEKYYENLLGQAIDSKDYSKAKTLVENYLNGTVTHKQIQFKKNTRGKYFKYQILVSKKLVY